LSPTFQNAAFEAMALGHRYELWPIERFDVATVAALLRRPDVLGANITVPFKEAVVPCVDELSALGARLGVINTVFRRGDQLFGDNTDVPALISDLEAVGMLTADVNRVVVLGAGGAARAAVAAFLDRDRHQGTATSLCVVNRTLEHAVQLRDQLAAAYARSIDVAPFEAIDEAPDLIIDATSMGLGASSGSAAFEAALTSLGVLRLDTMADSFFYDLKYSETTPFLHFGRGIGAKVANGLGMLVTQGAAAFEHWTGVQAPVGVMRASLGL
jgi:shikimate dehydrogenase